MPTALSVIVPAYNEQERIGQSLEKIQAYCRRFRPDHEVMVIDDGSRDGTAAVVRQHMQDRKNLKLLELEQNRGKGCATRTGVLASEGDWILCTDADLSAPIEQLDVLLERGRDHPIVVGSRSVAGANVLYPPPVHRIVMGRVFNWIVQALVVRGVADTQCGFKLYRRDAALDIFPRLTIDGYAFDVEVLYLAQRLGYGVCEVPVTWSNDERSKVRLFADSGSMFLDVLKIPWRHTKVSAGRR